MVRLYRLFKEGLQRICAVFLACLSKFKEVVPQSYFDEVFPEIKQTCLDFDSALIVFREIHPAPRRCRSTDAA